METISRDKFVELLQSLPSSIVPMKIPAPASFVEAYQIEFLAREKIGWPAPSFNDFCNWLMDREGRSNLKSELVAEWAELRVLRRPRNPAKLSHL